jgi:hypothetical protein
MLEQLHRNFSWQCFIFKINETIKIFAMFLAGNVFRLQSFMFKMVKQINRPLHPDALVTLFFCPASSAGFSLHHETS